MHTMMMQGHMENERKEQQYKNKVDQREHEYQLQHKEMALVCKEAREQRQMMNLMFMTMLN